MGDKDNTKVISTINGEFDLPEISNDIQDDGEEWKIDSRITDGDEEVVKILYQMVKKLAPDELRKQIKSQFVEELKKK